MSYAIRCSNCCFYKYLLEINQRMELKDSEKTGLIYIIRLRHRRTEWKAKNELGQWFLTDGEMIFHSCFDVFIMYCRMQHTEKTDQFWR